MLPGSDHPDIRDPWIRSSRYSLPPDQIIPRYSCPPGSDHPQIFASPGSDHPDNYLQPRDQIIPRYSYPQIRSSRYSRPQIKSSPDICAPRSRSSRYSQPLIRSSSVFWNPTCSLAGGLSPTFINAFLKSLLAIASSFSSVMVTTGSGCHRSLSKKNDWTVET